MKIALVSIGIGRILRGFESFTESLFVELRRAAPGLDVTLFQGGGPEGNGRVIIRNFFRQDWLRTCLGNGSAIRLEQRSYALPLYLYLRRGRFDIVHYNELAMGSALFHLRRLFGGRFRLLYCNGAPSPPVHYHHRCDFAQVLTGPMYEEARSFGISPERLFLLPYGVDAHRFSPENRFHRSRIRSQLGIPENALVVLTVAALKREHKRVDYVIRELASLKEPFWLLAAGQRTEDTPFLEKEAERLKITATQQEISERLSSMKSQFADDKSFEEALSRSGITQDILKERIKKSIIQDKVVIQSKGITVSKKEAEDFFNANK